MKIQRKPLIFNKVLIDFLHERDESNEKRRTCSEDNTFIYFILSLQNHQFEERIANSVMYIYVYDLM